MTSRHAVLVLGEALIDIVERDGGDAEFVGGSPANVAVGIARQDVPATLLTRLGRDDRGRRIAEQVTASGAVVHEASWTDAATSTARARLRADGSAEYDFDIVWALEADAAADAAAAASVVHSGSIALFLQPGGEVALATLERARQAGRVVTVDPNVRPALVGPDPRPVAERAFAAATASPWSAGSGLRVSEAMAAAAPAARPASRCATWWATAWNRPIGRRNCSRSPA